MKFQEIAIRDLQLNPMEMISRGWWLIAAGNESEGYNAMTASWGHLGAIWERPGGAPHAGLPTAIVYLRPSRYTREFLNREELFTISVFEHTYRKALAYLGTHSGRDGNKIQEAGLTPVFESGSICFSEAKITFICRKLYHAPLPESGFVDHGLVEHNYPQRDFHEMYIGEILKVLKPVC